MGPQGSLRTAAAACGGGGDEGGFVGTVLTQLSARVLMGVCRSATRCAAEGTGLHTDSQLTATLSAAVGVQRPCDNTAQ